MKNLFLILIITFFISLSLNCYDDNSSCDNPKYNRSIELTITGTCKIIFISDEYWYYDLPAPLVMKNNLTNTTHTIYYKIVKFTNDATTVTAVLSVDGVNVQTQSISDPYGYIEISYIIELI